MRGGGGVGADVGDQDDVGNRRWQKEPFDLEGFPTPDPHVKPLPVWSGSPTRSTANTNVKNILIAMVFVLHVFLVSEWWQFPKYIFKILSLSLSLFFFFLINHYSIFCIFFSNIYWIPLHCEDTVKCKYFSSLTCSSYLNVTVVDWVAYFSSNSMRISFDMHSSSEFKRTGCVVIGWEGLGGRGHWTHWPDDPSQAPEGRRVPLPEG